MNRPPKKPGSKPMSQATKQKLSVIAKRNAEERRKRRMTASNVIISGDPKADAAQLEDLIKRLPTLGEPLINHHSHYYKDVAHLETVDVYRVLRLFNVTDPCLQHAIKKLLVAGGRGAGKDITRDVQEAIDSLQRMQRMMEEDSKKS